MSFAGVGGLYGGCGTTSTDRREREHMRIVLSDFMSLDGVVQAPGGQGEDTDGGFAHGGWS